MCWIWRQNRRCKNKAKNLKYKLWFYFFNRTPPSSKNYELHFFHTKVGCVFKYAFKMESTYGDTQISDPLGYYLCHIFCRNIAERPGNINFLSEMTIVSNGLIKTYERV